MMKETGLIIKGFGELFEVLTESGEKVSCAVRGALKHKSSLPLAGDKVLFERQASGKAVIDSVCERRNSLIRPPMANLDKLFIVVATASPLPSFETLDKLTCAAVSKGIEPIIVINKTDIRSSNEIREIYEKSSIKIFDVCANKGEGIEELKKEISGICAFAGASGVGKSSLMNALFPDLNLTVGNLSDKSDRGKHTTRTVELFKVDGGYFADTPGFAMIDFEKFDFLALSELAGSFPEFAEHLKKCRYTDCTHTNEDGCGIIAAYEDGLISKSRYESYLALYEILKNKRTYH